MCKTIYQGCTVSKLFSKARLHIIPFSKEKCKSQKVTPTCTVFGSVTAEKTYSMMHDSVVD